MRYTLTIIAAFCVGIFVLAMQGCQTDQPGTTETLGSYTANVDSSPDKVTTAAAKAAEDLKLTNITSNGTKVDGVVSAMTAQGDRVDIRIEQAGENVSKVTIRVGTTGDEALSKQLIDKTNSHLHWL
jgi:hypothetical protein